MRNQNLILERLVSLNDNITYIVTLNLLGNIISHHFRDTTLKNIDIDRIASKFRKIMIATSLINFDNIKFLMYEEDNLKHVIINIQEMSMIVGFSKNTPISDVLHIIGELIKEQMLYGGP
jgi:hypothetical protein